MSMKEKASRSSMRETLRKRAQPLLALSYANAIHAVCGTRVYVNVSDKSYPRFIARQKQLDDIGISYDKYACTVVKSWWIWCRSKGMKSVPVNLFCGKKAWDRFLDMQDSTVRLDTTLQEDWSKNVYAEMNAAQIYIGAMLTRRLVSIARIREKFGGVHNEDVVREVLGLLNMLYGCNANSYNDIVTVILRRRGVSADILRNKEI